jgi:hypothetical protein
MSRLIPEVNVTELCATGLGGHDSLLGFGAVPGCLRIWVRLGSQVSTSKRTKGRTPVAGLVANTIGGGCIFVAHENTGGKPMLC